MVNTPYLAPATNHPGLFRAVYAASEGLRQDLEMDWDKEGAQRVRKSALGLQRLEAAVRDLSPDHATRWPAFEKLIESEGAVEFRKSGSFDRATHSINRLRNFPCTPFLPKTNENTATIPSGGIRLMCEKFFYVVRKLPSLVIYASAEPTCQSASRLHGRLRGVTAQELTNLFESFNREIRHLYHGKRR